MRSTDTDEVLFLASTNTFLRFIDAISIYTVPTFKAKPCGARKTNSVNSVADDVHIDVKPKKSLLDFYTTGSKQTLSAKLATKLPHRKRTKGL